MKKYCYINLMKLRKILIKYKIDKVNKIAIKQ